MESHLTKSVEAALKAKGYDFDAVVDHVAAY